MVIAVTLLVAVGGLVLFALAKNNPDLKEVGRLLFFAGVLTFLLNFGAASVSLFRR